MPDPDLADEVLLTTAKLNVQKVRERTPAGSMYWNGLVHVEWDLGRLAAMAKERTTE